MSLKTELRLLDLATFVVVTALTVALLVAILP